jgi:drug/metabolite transporter (DMT)-like permease
MTLAPVFAAAGLALLLWSGTPIANKIAVQYMDGLTAGVLRSLVAGAVALCIAWFGKLPFPQSRRDRFTLLLSGVSCFAIWPALMSIGLAHTSAGHGALIMATIPIFTVLIALLLEKRLPRFGWWLGAGIAFGATAILIAYQKPALDGSGGAPVQPGDLIILGGCVVCAIGYVCGGRISPKIGTVATTFWGLGCALALLVPVFALIATRTAWITVPYQGWLAIGWMTFCSSLLGYALWFFALGHGGIARMGSLQLSTPVLTVVAAWVILDEPATASLVLICAAIISGTYTAQRLAR